MILNAAGGECVDDFAHLRSDAGLAELIGHELPSPEVARKLLNALAGRGKDSGSAAAASPGCHRLHSRREPSAGGAGPSQPRSDSAVGVTLCRSEIFTVDQDATIIESRKREALYTYEGSRGYQPMLAVWAEMDVVLADEFRGTGMCRRGMPPSTVAKAAFAAAPTTVTSYYYRGDSACHENQLLRWLLNEKRADGPAGFNPFCGQRADE